MSRVSSLVPRRSASGSSIRTACLVAAALALAGCVSVAPATRSTGADRFSGRLSVRIDANGNASPRSFTAAFELEGNATQGRLDLSTPLGSILARARWSPESVVLATPRGDTAYPDLESLTHEVVGESLPVEALFDWLRGRPWPGAASRPAPAARGFEQLGWSVDLARFDEDALLTAHRARPPAVDVRIKLDR